MMVRLDYDLFTDGPGRYGIGIGIETDGKIGMYLGWSRIPAVGQKLGQRP
jgi:hypothetical protein